MISFSRNPPQEQGVREEWEDHVGWHRKEDLYHLRGRKANKQDGGGDANNSDLKNDNNKIVHLHLYQLKMPRVDNRFSPIILGMMMIIICILLGRILNYKWRRKGDRMR